MIKTNYTYNISKTFTHFYSYKYARRFYICRTSLCFDGWLSTSNIFITHTIYAHIKQFSKAFK